MCLIVVALDAAPRYPLVVAANRDERHSRPTQAAAWWPGGTVFGGRDLAAGGTWLAIERRGRFAAVTNIRDDRPQTGLRSRGALVAGFLSSSESAHEFAAAASGNGAAFGAFNMLLYDGRALDFASNRSDAKQLEPGLHAFSNAPPGTEWPKTTTALEGAAPLLALADPVEALFGLLAARDDSADDESRRQRAHFVIGAIHGTRCSTVVLIDAARRVTFVERSFDAAGEVVGEVRETFALEG